MTTAMKHYDSGKVEIAGELKELNRGLVLYLDGTYDSENGWFTDQSGNGNHGVPYNGATTGTGIVGDGMSFDGTNSYIDCGNDSSFDITTKLTITGYAYIDADAPIYNGVVSKEGAYQAELRNSSKIAHFNTWESTVKKYCWSSAVWDNSRWYFFAWVYDTGTLTLYVDGVPKSTSGYLANPIDTSANSVLIGNMGSYYTKGNLDEIRIYDRALDAEEITQLYKLGCAKLHDGTNISYNLGDLIVPELIENNGHDVTDGLVLWLDGSQDIDGKFIDRSGNGNHGTPYNGATTGSGVVGDGMSFDGSDDYIIVSFDSSLALENYTIVSWIKTSDNRGILGRLGGTYNYILQLESGKVFLRSYNGSFETLYSVSTNLTNNEYRCVVGIRDRTNLKMYMYVDGEYENERNIANADVGEALNNLYIGSRGDTVSAYLFNGNLDEIRIYDRALSSDEVATLYKRGMKMKYNQLMVSEFKEGESL